MNVRSRRTLEFRLFLQPPCWILELGLCVTLKIGSKKKNLGLSGTCPLITHALCLKINVS